MSVEVFNPNDTLIESVEFITLPISVEKAVFEESVEAIANALKASGYEIKMEKSSQWIIEFLSIWSEEVLSSMVGKNPHQWMIAHEDKVPELLKAYLKVV